MSIKKPRVHAVVVTYNRKKLLEERKCCFEADLSGR